MVDAQGRAAHFTGGKTLGVNAVSPGRDCVAAGNLLSNPGVAEAIAEGFAARAGLPLADRLLHGLECGLEAGGEVGLVHSAALLIASDIPWPLVDLRVDWSEQDPVAELRDLWSTYEPQMDDYVTRAFDPSAAPSYGVPGDE